MKRAEQPQVELKEGISLGGWTLVKELGSGAFGRVFECKFSMVPFLARSWYSRCSLIQAHFSSCQYVLILQQLIDLHRMVGGF